MNALYFFIRAAATRIVWLAELGERLDTVAAKRTAANMAGFFRPELSSYARRHNSEKSISSG